MKRIIILIIGAMILFVSLGGCFFYEDRDRGERGRDHERYEHERGGEHEHQHGEHDERR